MDSILDFMEKYKMLCLFYNHLEISTQISNIKCLKYISLCYKTD